MPAIPERRNPGRAANGGHGGPPHCQKASNKSEAPILRLEIQASKSRPNNRAAAVRERSALPFNPKSSVRGAGRFARTAPAPSPAERFGLRKLALRPLPACACGPGPQARARAKETVPFSVPLSQNSVVGEGEGEGSEKHFTHNVLV